MLQHKSSMNPLPQHIPQKSIVAFLQSILSQSATPTAQQWLQEKLNSIHTDFSTRHFFIAFSAAFRFFEKEEISFSTLQIQKANELCLGWNPKGMRAYEVARLIIFLHLPTTDKGTYFETVNKLFSAADMGELVSLYKSLIVYPYAEDYTLRTAEGIRTNIKNVFEAIALDNPYPAKYLNERQWNQLVLKSVFNGSPLYKIVGLEQRANATLSQQLSDYAHERWAAGRTVNPELWRAAAPFTNKALIHDYQKLLTSENNFERQAAALACLQSQHPQALALLNPYPELKNAVENNSLTWDNFSIAWYQSLIQ